MEDTKTVNTVANGTLRKFFEVLKEIMGVQSAETLKAITKQTRDP